MKCVIGKLAGFTLVELLVALLLATLILSAVSAFFASNHQTQLAVTQQLTQQEQERFASYLLTTSLQNACYSGCAALDEGAPVINHALAAEQQLVRHRCITILAASDSHLPPFLQGKALPGSDILWWHQASVTTVAVKNSVVAGEKQLIVDDTIKFNVGEAIVVGDCHQVELFSLTAGHCQV
ncbi:MAG: prepilin-type N-terminal cleavage/methylation domain-containing protein [Gammaproteobacteria bacterium]|nr:prepilin-type N-terminal cleavage/methylation domain-containing protein [Gammaproteobacteria bacterium]